MSNDLRLFKFRSINNWLIDSLINNTIYAAKAAELNDPLDAQIDFKSIVEHAIVKSFGERRDYLEYLVKTKNFFHNWQHQMGELGIFSFSLSDAQDSIVEESCMWSHYGDQHRGLCIEYLLEEKFIKNNYMDENAENRLTLCDEVEYKNEGITNELLNSPIKQNEEFVKYMLRKYLTIKRESWKYEREGRLIFAQSGPCKVGIGAINRIIFGLRTSQANKKLIATIARQYSGCQNFQELILHGESYSMRRYSVDSD